MTKGPSGQKEVRAVSITDDQFITAMHKAVAIRGKEYRFQRSTPGFYDGVAPMYQTPKGEGACMIGFALLLIDKRACPPYGMVASAPSILRPLGLSTNVYEAASIAQIAQDAGHMWGDCLAMFEHARLHSNLHHYDYEAVAQAVLGMGMFSEAQKSHATQVAAKMQTVQKMIDDMVLSTEQVQESLTAMNAGFLGLSTVVNSGAIATGGIIAKGPVVAKAKNKVNITFLGEPHPVEFVEYFQPVKSLVTTTGS